MMLEETYVGIDNIGVEMFYNEKLKKVFNLGARNIGKTLKIMLICCIMALKMDISNFISILAIN